jgi:hypothetical protein
VGAGRVQRHQRRAIARGDIGHPDLRVHDRVALANVLESEEMPNLVKHCTALHLRSEWSTAMVVKGERDLRGIDLRADVLPPRFSNSGSRESIHPLNYNIG